MRVIILSLILSLTTALAQAEAKLPLGEAKPAPADANVPPGNAKAAPADAKVTLGEAKLAQADANLAPGGGKPAPDEVRRVIDYYLHGKGTGPVLMETKLCRDIKRDGVDKNECLGDITAQPLKKGESVYLWMAYMVPEGEETQSIVVLFEKGGVTRSVESLQVSSQLRNRSWLKMSLDKVGPWKLKVVRDTGVGSESLGTLDVAVK